MKLEQLKKKLPNINISIDYTRTWKDSLQLGLGIVTTGGGLLLTLASGGSEIASVGSSSAISIPAAAEGIGIAGSGLAISFDALEVGKKQAGKKRMSAGARLRGQGLFHRKLNIE